MALNYLDMVISAYGLNRTGYFAIFINTHWWLVSNHLEGSNSFKYIEHETIYGLFNNS